jgi:hypothetical protein
MNIPKRLMTGVVGAVLGAAVGVLVGIYMKSNATTLQWLAIPLGSLGLIFGFLCKLTL